MLDVFGLPCSNPQNSTPLRMRDPKLMLPISCLYGFNELQYAASMPDAVWLPNSPEARAASPRGHKQLAGGSSRVKPDAMYQGKLGEGMESLLLRTAGICRLLHVRMGTSLVASWQPFCMVQACQKP